MEAAEKATRVDCAVAAALADLSTRLASRAASCSICLETLGEDASPALVHECLHAFCPLPPTEPFRTHAPTRPLMPDILCRRLPLHSAVVAGLHLRALLPSVQA